MLVIQSTNALHVELAKLDNEGISQPSFMPFKMPFQIFAGSTCKSGYGLVFFSYQMILWMICCKECLLKKEHLSWTKQNLPLWLQEATRKSIFRGGRGPSPPNFGWLFSTDLKRERRFWVHRPLMAAIWQGDVTTNQIIASAMGGALERRFEWAERVWEAVNSSFWAAYRAKKK